MLRQCYLSYTAAVKRYQQKHLLACVATGRYDVWQHYTTGRGMANAWKQEQIDKKAKDLDARVRELARSGDVVGAVRLYRNERKVGLKEARDYVQGLMK